jgi:hypothetical protein
MLTHLSDHACVTCCNSWKIKDNWNSHCIALPGLISWPWEYEWGGDTNDTLTVACGPYGAARLEAQRAAKKQITGSIWKNTSQYFIAMHKTLSLSGRKTACLGCATPIINDSNFNNWVNDFLFFRLDFRIISRQCRLHYSLPLIHLRLEKISCSRKIFHRRISQVAEHAALQPRVIVIWPNQTTAVSCAPMITSHCNLILHHY